MDSPLKPPDAPAPHAASAIPWHKRAVDLGCCLVFLPVLLGLVVFMLILNRLRSPGPVFFKQDRVGFAGRSFPCTKLRTMHVGASAATHQKYIEDLFASGKPMVKMEQDGDLRMIPGTGTFRASGLDEVPQILNVLRGEMSFVGPRPWTHHEHSLLSPHYQRRTQVVPGLTGLWQVSGKNKTTVQEMLELDLYYVDHRSFALDLKIILKTLPMLIAQILQSRRKSPFCKDLAARMQSLFHLEVPDFVKNKLSHG